MNYGVRRKLHQFLRIYKDIRGSAVSIRPIWVNQECAKSIKNALSADSVGYMGIISSRFTMCYSEVFSFQQKNKKKRRSNQQRDDQEDENMMEVTYTGFICKHMTLMWFVKKTSIVFKGCSAQRLFCSIEAPFLIFVLMSSTIDEFHGPTKDQASEDQKQG